MATHEVKILPKYFNEVISGCKTFELRYNDRNYKEGDCLYLREWTSDGYTTRGAYYEITYVLHGPIVGLETGYVILGIRND